jgi:hypothetical protein
MPTAGSSTVSRTARPIKSASDGQLRRFIPLDVGPLVVTAEVAEQR